MGNPFIYSMHFFLLFLNSSHSPQHANIDWFWLCWLLVIELVFYSSVIVIWLVNSLTDYILRIYSLIIQNLLFIFKVKATAWNVLFSINTAELSLVKGVHDFHFVLHLIFILSQHNNCITECILFPLFLLFLPSLVSTILLFF